MTANAVHRIRSRLIGNGELLPKPKLNLCLNWFAWALADMAVWLLEHTTSSTEHGQSLLLAACDALCRHKHCNSEFALLNKHFPLHSEFSWHKKEAGKRGLMFGDPALSCE